MNKENAYLYLPLVQALTEGKTVQFEYAKDIWKSFVNLEFTHSPEKYRIKPEPSRTFKMWFYKPTGRMYPWVEGEKQYVESDEWERITVQEVLE
jgi:hypothetical protein